MRTHAATFTLALASPALAAVTNVTADREIFGSAGVPATFGFAESDKLGLFDEAFDLTPGPARTTATHTSNATVTDGLLRVDHAAEVFTAVLEDVPDEQPGAGFSSRMTVEFQVLTDSPWSLVADFSNTGEAAAFGGFRLDGPDSEPVVDISSFELGDTSFEKNGVLTPGAYTLRIDFSATSGTIRQLGSKDIASNLDFTVVPAPSALALLTIAPLVTRRRR